MNKYLFSIILSFIFASILGAKGLALIGENSKLNKIVAMMNYTEDNQFKIQVHVSNEESCVKQYNDMWFNVPERITKKNESELKAYISDKYNKCKG